MTEHEKIFAGKLFNARGAELKAVKHKAHNLCTEYNSLMGMIRAGQRSCVRC